MTSTMRPDEKVALSEIERASSRDRTIKKGINTAVGLGTTALGIGATAKIAPFLSKYLTPEIAMKGINKVNPRLGEFLKTGMEKGLNVQDGINYIKENLMGQTSKEAKEPAKQTKNIIEQYSPELNQFMSQEIQKGRSPIEAAALAQNNKKFSDIIQKMSKDHKANWSAIVESIYGGGQKAQQPQQQPQQMQQPQPQQGGNTDQALMAAFDKILKM